jgi:hypothetical protein
MPMPADDLPGSGAPAERWCRPSFDRRDHTATPGTTATLALTLHNPFPAARTVTLDLSGADGVTAPASIPIAPGGQTTVALVLAVAPDRPPGAQRLRVIVRHVGSPEPVGEASADVTVLARPAVSMTLLDVVTTSRPPVSEATVRVANSGNVTVRPRLSAVDDWSAAGSVPAEPPEVELRRGRHRDVRVATRRPLVRPFSRHRRGSVTVYADLDGTPVPGPGYDVPPVVSRIAVVIGVVAVLVAGLGAVLLRPTERPAGPSPAATAPDATAGVERSTDPPPAGEAPADPNAAPADIVFDTPDDASPHTPVLVARDRSTVSLPPGGRITTAVKVPSGWVVKRQMAAGESSRIRFRVQYVRGGEVLDLAPGVPDPSFWVDEIGTRIAIDGRDGQTGAVTVLSLPGLVAEATTALPEHVRVVAWLGAAVLVSTRDTAGSWHFGQWSVADPYVDVPSRFTGSFLGTGGGALAIHQRDGELDCVVQIADIFEPAKQALRCGLGVPVDSDVLQDRWSPVSPGGRYLAVPGPNRSAYFAPLPPMLKGLAGFVPAAGLPGPVADITWRDGTTAAVLVRGDDTRIWTCAADRGACRPAPLVRPDGLSSVQLVARVPAGG